MNSGKENGAPNKRWDMDGAEIYLLEHTQEKSYCLTMKDGLLERHFYEEGERPSKVFLTLSLFSEVILDAMVDGLKRAGHVAEVDNAQRITAEARNEEKEEQIGWLRKQIEKQL